MNMVIIGTILKDRIKEKGYTQEEFCELVGIGLSSLKKYMNGKVFYSIDTLELFANALVHTIIFLEKVKLPNLNCTRLKS